jgi:hypothetical protein
VEALGRAIESREIHWVRPFRAYPKALKKPSLRPNHWPGLGRPFRTYEVAGVKLKFRSRPDDQLGYRSSFSCIEESLA